MALWLWMVLACQRQVADVVEVDVSGTPPDGWQWVTSSEHGYEVLFPGMPKEEALTRETFDWGDGPRSMGMYRAEVGRTASFIILSGPLAGGGVSSREARRITRGVLEARASRVGEVLEVRSWGEHGLGVGFHADIETGRPGGAAIRTGLAGDTLWMLHAVGDRKFVVPQFMSSFSLVEPAPMTHPLAQLQITCPSRCAPFEDQVRMRGALGVVGLRGILDHDVFEAVAVSVPDGAEEEVIEALRERAFRMDPGRIESEERIEGGVRLEVVGSTRSWIHVQLVGDYGYALRVRSDTKEPLPWAEAFFGSLDAPPGAEAP